MSLLSYSGVTTKIRAMSGKMLTSGDYDTLCSLTSVGEYVQFLRSQPSYAPVFDSVDVANLHRGDIEKILTNGIYVDYQKIYRFSNQSQRNFLELYFMRYQIKLIKSCLRMVFNQQSPELNYDLFQDFISKHANINLSKLSSSKSIQELVENLQGSEFYEQLNQLIQYPHSTLFDYEMKLDLFYFTTVWKNKKKYLKGEDLEIITHTLGSQIDMLNIQWIYRAKKYYQMPSVDIYQLIVPINYKLKRQQITHLVETESLTDYERVLNTTYYRNTFQALESLTLEGAYNNLQNKLHETDSRKKPYTVAIINSYLYQKEQEVKKLISALECIRYGYSQQQIKSILNKQ